MTIKILPIRFPAQFFSAVRFFFWFFGIEEKKLILEQKVVLKPVCPMLCIVHICTPRVIKQVRHAVY